MYSSDIPKMCSSSGLCTLCQRNAEWTCQRCLDFYCSAECQRKDWQRHRYICFSMPGLMPATPLGVEPSEICRNQSAVTKKLGSDKILDSPKEGFISGYSNSLKKYEIKKMPNVHSSVTVILLGFISSNLCIVRPLRDSDECMEVMRKIDTCGRRLPLYNNPQSTPRAALTMLNGVMSRVEVLSIQDEKRIKVLFYDYGITATVNKCDLRAAPEDILALPRFSTTVKLDNVQNFSYEENISFFQRFEGIECEMRNCPKTNEELEVELISLDGKIHINEEIEKYYSNKGNTDVFKYKRDDLKQLPTHTRTVEGETNEELLVDLSQDLPIHGDVQTILKPMPAQCIGNFENKPILTPPFDIYVFKPDMPNFKVVVLDTSALCHGYIGCIAETDLKYLVRIQEYLANYKDKEHFYNPKLHEYCLARFENEWYRARVVKVVDQSRFAVVYLDFTNESILTSQDIRRYPEDLNGPCRTNLCLIDGLPKSLKSEHINFLKKEITTESKLLIDRVKEVVQQIVVIQCNNVIKKMSSIGLI